MIPFIVGAATGLAIAVLGGAGGVLLQDYRQLAKEVRAHLASFKPQAAPKAATPPQA